MSVVVGLLIWLLFLAAQGGVIFATAFFCLKKFGWTHWFAKCAAMTVSWFLWVVITFVGYFMLGGDGGFMDGAGMIMMLCFSALISTVIFSVGWIVVPYARRSANG